MKYSITSDQITLVFGDYLVETAGSLQVQTSKPIQGRKSLGVGGIKQVMGGTENIKLSLNIYATSELLKNLVVKKDNDVQSDRTNITCMVAIKDEDGTYKRNLQFDKCYTNSFSFACSIGEIPRASIELGCFGTPISFQSGPGAGFAENYDETINYGDIQLYYKHDDLSEFILDTYTKDRIKSVSVSSEVQLYPRKVIGQNTNLFYDQQSNPDYKKNRGGVKFVNDANGLKTTAQLKIALDEYDEADDSVSYVDWFGKSTLHIDVAGIFQLVLKDVEEQSRSVSVSSDSEMELDLSLSGRIVEYFDWKENAYLYYNSDYKNLVADNPYGVVLDGDKIVKMKDALGGFVIRTDASAYSGEAIFRENLTTGIDSVEFTKSTDYVTSFRTDDELKEIKQGTLISSCLQGIFTMVVAVEPDYLTGQNNYEFDFLGKNNGVSKEGNLLDIVLFDFKLNDDQTEYVVKDMETRGGERNITYNDCSNLFRYRDDIIEMENMSMPNATDCSRIFERCYNLKKISGFLANAATNTSSAFSFCENIEYVENLSLEQDVDCSLMFSNCWNLIGVSGEIKGSVINPSYMFVKCHSIVETPTINIDGASEASGMFAMCNSIRTIRIKNTNTITSSLNMFNGCENLDSIQFIEENGGTTFEKVEQFTSTFNGCKNLKTVGTIDTSSGVTFTNMYANMGSMEMIKNSNFESGTNFKGFAENNTGIKSIVDGIKFSSATNCESMFMGCRNLSYFPPNAFDLATACNNYDLAFYGCALSAESIENILVSINFAAATTNLENGVLDISGGTNTPKSSWTSSATGAYNSLVGRNWTIRHR